MVALYPFYSAFNGYVTARMYRLWNGSNWLVCGMLASVALPYFLLFCLLIIDLCEFYETKQASLLPVSDVFIIAALWLCINCPITMMGAFYGFGQTKIELPC